MLFVNEASVIDRLKQVLDELCGPDLTLPPRRVLRVRLLELIDGGSCLETGQDHEPVASEGPRDIPTEFNAFASLLQGPCVPT